MTTEFFNSAQSAVAYAATAAEVILLVRLAALGVLREFKIFSTFLAFDAIRTLTLIGWDYYSHSYEWIWALSAPIWTLLFAAVSLELSAGLRQPFPQETGNRVVALYGFLMGMTVSVVASMLIHPQLISRPAVLLTIFAKRCILSGCILAILAQGAYLALGSAPLMANWRKHRRVLLTYMVAQVIGSFTATSTNTQFSGWTGLSRDISLLGCFCVWIVCTRPAFGSLRASGTLTVDEQLAECAAFNHRSKAPLHPALLLPDTEG